MKYYFQKGAESCFNLEYHKDYMRVENINSLVLHEAVKESGTGYFYCRDLSEVGETGQCGKVCKAYSPNNGKSGICKHHKPVYREGKEITITI
jgi:hypothetical protein